MYGRPLLRTWPVVCCRLRTMWMMRTGYENPCPIRAGRHFARGASGQQFRIWSVAIFNTGAPVGQGGSDVARRTGIIRLLSVETKYALNCIEKRNLIACFAPGTMG